MTVWRTQRCRSGQNDLSSNVTLSDAVKQLLEAARSQSEKWDTVCCTDTTGINNPANHCKECSQTLWFIIKICRSLRSVGLILLVIYCLLCTSPDLEANWNYMELDWWIKKTEWRSRQAGFMKWRLSTQSHHATNVMPLQTEAVHERSSCNRMSRCRRTAHAQGVNRRAFWHISVIRKDKCNLSKALRESQYHCHVLRGLWR